ncbi:MAG: HDOD domain-containing protein, partial [candidate division Zixibacteria bacterium]|nr:HDOD domain-containing protein [candidate division Zixibacteria bacterium]
MSRTIDVAKDIVQNNELMALPEAVLQVLESVDRDEISIDSLSNIINKDPALTGRVLKIANSPFYGLAQKVISVHQAVMILGMTTVKCLTLSAAIFNREKLEHDVGIDIGMLYSNIISVAVTSRKLAITYGYSSPENAFTCGLLHDIGLLYFLHHYPIEYKLILSNIKESGAVFDEEKKQLGLTHPEAGEMIVR